MIGAQIKEYARPLWVSLLALFGGVATYDGVSGQFDLPKLSTLFGKTGSLLPWWGWLLVIQAIAVAALFDYVRRNVPVALPQQLPVNPERLVAIETKLENVRVDGAINHTDLRKLQAEVQRYDERTRSAFQAIYLRELLSDLEAQLNEDAAMLYSKIKNGEAHDAASWDSWDSIHHHWEGLLTKWLGMARWYVADVERRVLEVSEQEYSQSRWTFEDRQFPNAEANRRFKRHRLILKHWEDIKGTVNNNVRSVAYHGLTERDVRNASAAEKEWPGA
ncbi:hypothetical protein [uncultured Novosphingobium sp.]|uniref:hypothetical protein n=1 Tax=uncultured Novosphingobium sp. TaxID=292277 RepID=UPI002584A496|nr:hypothetical protein [uncultured Novosphingobium sp.]